MRYLKLLTVLAMAASEASAETGSRRLIVSLADHKLAFIEDGQVVKVFPVAVGKSSTPSPTGSFQIISRTVKPTWYHAGKVVPPGPANPVGTRWIGLSHKGYGIHGTNAPRSIGKSASHGCIRMRNQDVEKLFELVQVGDPVELVSTATGDNAKFFQIEEAPTEIALAGGGQ